MKITKALSIAVALLLWASVTEAGAGQKEHPVIKAIPGFSLEGDEFKDYSSYKFKHEKEGPQGKKATRPF